MSDLARKLDSVWSYTSKLKAGVMDVTTVTTSLREKTKRNSSRNRYALEPSGYGSEPTRYAGYVGHADTNTTIRKRDDYEERAAIAEHCGGLPKVHAEVLAALQVADLGPNAEQTIDAAARALDRMAEIKRSPTDFDERQEVSTVEGEMTSGTAKAPRDLG